MLKRLILVPSLALTILLCLGGCSAPNVSPDPEPGQLTLSVTVPETRATVTATAAEKAVSHVDWLVYDTQGDLVSHTRSTTSETVIPVSAGEYTFVAVVNYPSEISEASVSTLSGYSSGLTVLYSGNHLNPAYENISIGLSTGTHGNVTPVFVMRSDPVTRMVTGGDTVSLPVKRVCCKISLTGTITYSENFVEVMGSRTSNPENYIVYGAFLINVPSVVTVSDGTMSGSAYDYAAASAFDYDFLDGFWNLYPTFDSSQPYTSWDMSGAEFNALFPAWFKPVSYYPGLYSGSSISGVFSTFYCHPNSAAESSSRFEEDNVTRLVLWTSTGFYPIPLSGIVSNQAVVISDIVFDGPGSDNPAGVLDNHLVRYNYSSLANWVYEEEIIDLVLSD